MVKYRISVSFDEKNFFWIVIDNGRFIRSPTEKDLIGAKIKAYNKTNVCSRCREENNRNGIELTDKSILYPGNALRERDIEGNETRRFDCANCYQKYDPNSWYNIRKSLGDRRTGNQDPNSTQVLGDNSLKLACDLYGWIDLNKKNDNYTRGTPIDCYDPKTGLYHQVQARYYSYKNRYWHFTNFEKEWKKKKYEDMVCFCISEDGKIVERIYIFPWKEIIELKRTNATIVKNPSKGGGGWYAQYRRTDENELKKANEIWIQILERRKKKILN